MKAWPPSSPDSDAFVGALMHMKENVRGELTKKDMSATDVSLAGAHGSMQVVDDKGQVWDITLAPAARTERAGLKPGVLLGSGSG